MDDPATLVAKITGIVFVTTSMLAAGLAMRRSDLGSRLRRPRPLVVALIVNFVVAPFVAWGLTRLLPVDPGHAVGLLLLGAAAGAPFLPKAAAMAKADVTLGVTVMGALVIGTVAFLPVAAPILIPGAEVNAWAIARPLLVLIVAPLALGFAARARWDAGSVRVEKPLAKFSDVCLIGFIVLVFATHIDEVKGAIGSGAILAAALFVLITGGIAYAIAGPDAGTRRVMILGTAQRNVAAALVTAGNSFADQPNAVVMVLVTDVVALATLLIAVMRFRQLATATASDAGGTPGGGGG